MYGLVNRSIEELVVGRYGVPTWEQIRAAAGIEEEVFLSNESYPDSVTYQLVGAASRILGLSPAQILEAFGEHWVTRTATENYGAMMDMSGRTLPEFLRNLNNLHSRVCLLFPKLTPPSFSVADETERSVVVHYQSTREGLAHFVIGLLRGLGARFGTPVTVTQVGWRNAESDRDSFLLEWQPVVTASAAA